MLVVLYMGAAGRGVGNVACLRKSVSLEVGFEVSKAYARPSCSQLWLQHHTGCLAPHHDGIATMMAID